MIFQIGNNLQFVAKNVFVPGNTDEISICTIALTPVWKILLVGDFESSAGTGYIDVAWQTNPSVAVAKETATC